MPAENYNDDSDFKSDGEFRVTVAEVLEDFLDQLDEVDADFDPELKPGNLIVKFEDGHTYVLSQQTPTHELWLSAEMTAWHFKRVDGTWIERDSGEPMLDLLSGLVSKRLGLDVALTLS